MNYNKDNQEIGTMDQALPLAAKLLNDMTHVNDEIIEGFTKLEQLTAIIACTISYCEAAFEGKTLHNITAMLNLGESVIDKACDHFNNGIQSITTDTYEDFYTNICIDCDNIKAVATAGRMYADSCSFSPDFGVTIDGVFRTIENYITAVNNKMKQVEQHILNIAGDKSEPQNDLTETEGAE